MPLGFRERAALSRCECTTCFEVRVGGVQKMMGKEQLNVFQANFLKMFLMSKYISNEIFKPYTWRSWESVCCCLSRIYPFSTTVSPPAGFPFPS